jgi:hypothetical protein
MPTITPDQMRHWTNEQRQRAIDWARANGLNENDVSAMKPIEIGEGAIAYHRFVRNSDGKIQRHPTLANEAWTEPEIARYLVELPDGL